MIRKLIFALALLIATPGPAYAQEASAELRARAEQVAELLRGEADPAEMFTPAFLAQVPATQLRTTSGQLTAQYGAPQGVEGIDVRSATAGTIRLGMARAVLRLDIQIEPNAPHRISGLLVAGADTRGDSLAAIVEEMRMLPGRTALSVVRLGEEPAVAIAHNADQPLAIGSAFKLIVLAELSRQIGEGRHRWDEVVRIDRRSLPSGQLQDWPEGAPVTIHTLAALMISRSDNTATDILLHLTGRENVERMMARIGIAPDSRNQPFLSTYEAFVLKAGPEPVRRAWAAADEAGRRQLLVGEVAAVTREQLDPTRFASPTGIDTIEWFVSTADLARVMAWLLVNGDDSARAILAISPGVDAATARDFGYLGYKGGSEAGVINMTYLVRNRAGVWHAVAGSWNDPAGPVDNNRFAALMARAIQQLR